MSAAHEWTGRDATALRQAMDAEKLDEVIGGWLRDLARAGRLEPLLTAIAIDGKWLRGVGDGQVKLFAALLHEEKMIIAQHRIPDETTETTQVKELLEPVDLQDAVVTADAAHAQRETAGYIAGPEEDGGRESDYFLFVEHASHCSCCWSWRVKESSLAVSGLDTEPFASAGEVDGVELAIVPESSGLVLSPVKAGPSSGQRYRCGVRAVRSGRRSRARESSTLATWLPARGWPI